MYLCSSVRPYPADTWEEWGEWQGEAVLRHRQQGLTLTAIWGTETNTQHNLHHRHKYSTLHWYCACGRHAVIQLQEALCTFYSTQKCSCLQTQQNILTNHTQRTCTHTIPQPMLIVSKHYMFTYFCVSDQSLVITICHTKQRLIALPLTQRNMFKMSRI